MWKLHAAHLPVLAAAAVALGGCAGAPKAEMPAGVMLAGNWKLDHASSDDPQKVIATMQAEARKILRRQAAQMAAADAMAASRGAVGPPSADANPLGGDDSAGGSGHGQRRDPLRYSPMMHTLSQVLARGDYLTVHQSSDEFALDFGTLQRSYTPGARSVVSAEMGVADQTSGWEGREYVINVKAQVGSTVVERFSLSADGAHLIDRIHIGAAELPAVSLTRVYDRSTETAPPRAPPTSD